MIAQTDRFPGTACALAVFLALASPPLEATASTASDPGWELVLVADTRSVPAERLERAISEAIPAPLKDPGANFTQDPLYRPDASYRIVMAFHGDIVIEPQELCRDPDAVEPDRARLSDLMMTTNVTTALCEDERVLSNAEDRMTGQLTPDRISFRFLVADVVKQLFPAGFGRLPGVAP